MVGKVMLIGIGELGYHILQNLADAPNIGKIIVADYSLNAEGKVNLVIYTAALRGLYPDIEFRRIDLYDVKGTAEILKEEKPDVICNATVIQSWWAYHLLPEEIAIKLNSAGLGPQLPFHLTLTYKLMKAIKQSGIETRVINCSYSDVVNPVLAKVGLAPVCGGGNVDTYAQVIRRFVSKEFGVPMRSIIIYIYGHHGLLSSFFNAPFLAKIYVYDKDVTNRYPPDKIRKIVQPFAKADMGAWASVPPQEDIAASFTRNLLAVYGNTYEFCYAHGPTGLPGGYPVRLSYEKGAEILLPEGITLEEAIRVNEESGRVGDGIEKIKDDGTVVFTEKAVKIYKEVLRYECEELKIEESEERAKELKTLFRKLGEKYGLKI
jgi:hypothetical protein